MSHTPKRIDPYSPSEMRIQWEDDQTFAVPYVEMRYYCPCAGCIDENTGERTIQKSSISPQIRPTDAQLVGRYAVQITWTDGHNTGMYHYDRLHEICEKQGKIIA